MTAGFASPSTGAPVLAGAGVVPSTSTYPLPSLPATFTVDSFTVSRERLHRVYWASQDPLAPSVKRGNRYDCPLFVETSHQFGVLYLGYEFETCWLETVVRDTIVRQAGATIPIPIAKMTDRWACEVHISGTLSLARFADECLLDLGESASNVMGDQYLRTREWSRLLHAHANPQLDGIYYRSRFKASEFCIALFDRGISKGNLTPTNQRSIDPAKSREIQSVLKRFNVAPV